MRPRRDRPAGGVVRPTTGKVLVSLLATLEPSLPGVRALDLFAGSGQVGLGFLRRGAAEVDFVESHPSVLKELKQRLQRELGDQPRERCQVYRANLPGGLSRLRPPYQLIWADPPYDWPDRTQLLSALAPLAAPEARLVIEHHHKAPYPDQAGWRCYRQAKFGETRLSYFERDEPTC